MARVKIFLKKWGITETVNAQDLNNNFSVLTNLSESTFYLLQNLSLINLLTNLEVIFTETFSSYNPPLIPKKLSDTPEGLNSFEFEIENFENYDSNGSNGFEFQYQYKDINNNDKTIKESIWIESYTNPLSYNIPLFISEINGNVLTNITFQFDTGTKKLTMTLIGELNDLTVDNFKLIALKVIKKSFGLWEESDIEVKLTKAKTINVQDQKITNLLPATEDKDAVNYTQLFKVIQDVSTNSLAIVSNRELIRENQQNIEELEIAITDDIWFQSDYTKGLSSFLISPDGKSMSYRVQGIANTSKPEKSTEITLTLQEPFGAGGLFKDTIVSIKFDDSAIVDYTNTGGDADSITITTTSATASDPTKFDLTIVLTSTTNRYFINDIPRRIVETGVYNKKANLTGYTRTDLTNLINLASTYARVLASFDDNLIRPTNDGLILRLQTGWNEFESNSMGWTYNTATKEWIRTNKELPPQLYRLAVNDSDFSNSGFNNFESAVGLVFPAQISVEGKNPKEPLVVKIDREKITVLSNGVAVDSSTMKFTLYEWTGVNVSQERPWKWYKIMDNKYFDYNTTTNKWEINSSVWTPQLDSRYKITLEFNGGQSSTLEIRQISTSGDESTDFIGTDKGIIEGVFLKEGNIYTLSAQLFTTPTTPVAIYPLPNLKFIVEEYSNKEPIPIIPPKEVLIKGLFTCDDGSSGKGGGVYHTENFGGVWTLLKKFDEARHMTFVPNGTLGDRYYVATTEGLFQMTTGVDWKEIKINGKSENVSFVEYIDTKIYVAITGKGVYSTSDLETFDLETSAPLDPRQILLDGDDIWIIDGTDTPNSFYRKTLTGSWTQVEFGGNATSGLFKDQGGKFVVMSPFSGGTIISGLFTSTDGATWTPIQTNLIRNPYAVLQETIGGTPTYLIGQLGTGQSAGGLFQVNNIADLTQWTQLVPENLKNTNFISEIGGNIVIIDGGDIYTAPNASLQVWTKQEYGGASANYVFANL